MIEIWIEGRQYTPDNCPGRPCGQCCDHAMIEEVYNVDWGVWRADPHSDSEGGEA